MLIDGLFEGFSLVRVERKDRGISLVEDHIKHKVVKPLVFLFQEAARDVPGLPDPS